MQIVNLCVLRKHFVQMSRGAHRSIVDASVVADPGQCWPTQAWTARLVRRHGAQVQRAQKFVGNRQLPQGLRDDVMRHMDATRSAPSDVDAGEIFPRLSHILQARHCKGHNRDISCTNVLGSQGRLKLPGTTVLLIATQQALWCGVCCLHTPRPVNDPQQALRHIHHIVIGLLRALNQIVNG